MISGDDASVSQAIDRLAAEGVAAERLNVSHAFHSTLMDPMLDAFESVARTIVFRTPRIGIVSIRSIVAGVIAGNLPGILSC